MRSCIEIRDLRSLGDCELASKVDRDSVVSDIRQWDTPFGFVCNQAPADCQSSPGDVLLRAAGMR